MFYALVNIKEINKLQLFFYLFAVKLSNLFTGEEMDTHF